MKNYLSRWASETQPSTTDWIEFVGPPGEGEDKPRKYRVDVSFMLSTFSCIYGKGCPSVLITGATGDRGCCQIGVHIAHDEFARVEGYVNQLTDEDADFIDEIRGKEGWQYRVIDEDERADFTAHTRTIDGGCIFQNRAGGPSGKPGCALHVLAERIGVHYTETKPDICWQIPLSVSEEELDDDQVQVTVTSTPGSAWGGDGPNRSLNQPGWFCTETPDAFTASDKLVFRSHEPELRKLLGDSAYEMMASRLEDIAANGGRRYPTPAETINGGRPLIPLMVSARVARWDKRGRTEQLDRSKQWLADHPEQDPRIPLP